ncbi:MAG: hypothetical protein OHK0013_30040 [Sandaracinaceae bacterium]
MPFDYYDSLSAKNKRIYRASDAVSEIVLPGPALEALRVKTRRIRGALAAVSQRATQSACRELVRGIAEALCVPIPDVRVHEVRPSGAYGELHGLYTRWPDGRARIEVWMRTAVNEQPVAFRTFLRTLLHEVVHHLDYVHLALEDSFHTEGFFRRESSLVRQLDVAPQESARKRRTREDPPPDETRDEKLARLRARLMQPRRGTSTDARAPHGELAPRAAASVPSHPSEPVGARHPVQLGLGFDE